MGGNLKLLPYFRWFPADAESDSKYASMTLSELGLYHRCLNHSWLNGGLPTDAGEIARGLRIAPREFMKSWPRVSLCFSGTSVLTNARQEEERSHAQTKSQRATESVQSRYGRNTNVERTNNERDTDDLPRAYGSVSESVSKDFSLRFEAAFSRHKKNRQTETKNLVAQMLLSVDWELLERTHKPFCEFWDRHDWTKCPLTLLEWWRNGMPGPPLEVAVNGSPPKKDFVRDVANVMARRAARGDKLL